MTARLHIRFAGPHVSVQDGGRPGLARYGVPASGAMDRLALMAANLALGNKAEAAAIEVSLGGLVVECREGPVSFAVAGGGFIVDHAGHKGASWQVGTLLPGETLTLRRGPWGAWCYLAFSGQMAAPEWLGSQATHSQSGFGGGKLATGRGIEISAPRVVPDRPIPCPPFARPLLEMRATLGPQDRFFAPDQIAALTDAVWHLTDAYDRMGVRRQWRNLICHQNPWRAGRCRWRGMGWRRCFWLTTRPPGAIPRSQRCWTPIWTACASCARKTPCVSAL